MIDSEKATIDLQATEKIKPISEFPYGSIFVLGEEFQEDKFISDDAIVPELLEQPLMKTKLFKESNFEKYNFVVGLYDGSAYAVDKNFKCKLIEITNLSKVEEHNENNWQEWYKVYVSWD